MAQRTRFGQLIIGPPGAGKSTYCYGLQQFFAALGRPASVINLDPAAPSTPYDCAVNISELISLEEVMVTLHLGPNGGMLYCMEYLEKNLDWLEDAIAALPTDHYLIFDTPGQVELSTDHDSLRAIVERLQKLDVRLAAVHLTDAHHVSDASKYVSVLLLALRTMLQMELPHINVLSKVDLIAQHGKLPFNLDFYTEVQDLSYLQDLLDAQGPRGKRYAALNHAICEIVEDFALVSFQTLCVEDKHSMASLVKVIDQAIGYTQPSAHYGDPNVDPSLIIRSLADATPLDRPHDVQERYIDRREEYKAWERDGWQREAELARKASTRPTADPPDPADVALSSST